MIYESIRGCFQSQASQKEILFCLTHFDIMFAIAQNDSCGCGVNKWCTNEGREEGVVLHPYT